MNDTTQQPSASLASCCGPGPQQTPGGDPADVRGPMMADMAGECPCGKMIKGHPLAAFGVFTLIGLMFLISQVGGILGIIALVRTL